MACTGQAGGPVPLASRSVWQGEEVSKLATQLAKLLSGVRRRPALCIAVCSRSFLAGSSSVHKEMLSSPNSYFSRSTILGCMWVLSVTGKALRRDSAFDASLPGVLPIYSLEAQRTRSSHSMPVWLFLDVGSCAYHTQLGAIVCLNINVDGCALK